MPFSYDSDISTKVDGLRSDVEGLVNPKKTRELRHPIPREGSDDVATYITNLYEDFQKFEKAYFNRTEHMRPKVPGARIFDTPSWRKSAEALAFGRNFDVWGKRAEDWMQERVDAEIPRNMRIRKDHLSANWHEIEVQPNIKGVADIFNQERKKMGWKDWVEEFIGTAQQYGNATNQITIDYNVHPDGQVAYKVRKPGQVGRTPESLSFQKSDGCNWAIVFETVNDKQIEEDFPDVDVSELQTTSDARYDKYDHKKDVENDYQTVTHYPKFTAYIDDTEVESVPFDDEHQGEMNTEMMTMLTGQPVEAREDQHHLEHIRQKWDALHNLLSVPPEDAQDVELGNHIAAAHLENIHAHLKMALKDDLSAKGLKPKYPHGRYVCVIGNKVIKDVPNPFGVPWRMLFRDLTNQRVIGRIDGAGDPEVMFNEQFYIDMQLSRIEDISLLQIPQVFRHFADKALKGEDSNDNSPRRIRYYHQQPPHVVRAEKPEIQIELYKIAKANISRDRGVDDTAYGKKPPGQTSAKLVDTLQKANRPIIAGELDRNLREALEDIVEGTFEVWKVFYKQPRKYLIDAQYQDVIVSDLLKKYTVTDPTTGEKREEELPKIEVTVKPGSNYPDQWEKRLSFFLEMSQYKDPNGMPIIPPEAILDHISIQYPEFGEGGKYRLINQATQIGMAVLKQHEEQRAQVAKQKDAITSAMNQHEKEKYQVPQNGNQK